MRHRQAGCALLQGRGMEVGAFHRPAPLPSDCHVIRCDVRSVAETQQAYPELRVEQLVPVDLVIDMDRGGFAPIASDSLDFVVCCQVIEHLANPILAIAELFRVTKPGGAVVIATHDKQYAPDRKRHAPSFAHLREEYLCGVSSVAEDHYLEFLRVLHPRVVGCGGDELEQALRTVRLRRESAHAWDSRAFEDFLEQALSLLGLGALKLFESRGADNRHEYFSVWMKRGVADEPTLNANELRSLIERLTGRLCDRDLAIERWRGEAGACQERLGRVMHSRAWHLLDRAIRLKRVARHLPAAPGAVAAYLRSHGGTFAALADLRLVMRNHAQQGARVMLSSALRHVWSAQYATPEPRTSWRPEAVVSLQQIYPHRASVDIVVCVHNALDDVRRCLSSIVCNTLPPVNLILVDDGSDAPTRDYLMSFAAAQDAMLLRNDQARGYTYAANQGMQASIADYVVLLNSDTLVTPDWLDRLIMCAESDAKIGMVGPLSNTASWQSVPEVEADGDWAVNTLPPDVSVERMAQLIASRSARLYPRIPFLNGFCLVIKRELIEAIGYFDEATFGAGYGEENDYCLRARQSGWDLAIADDVYVFHAQSKSYSNERRKALCDRAGAMLAHKHGHEVIEQGVGFCREDRVLQGMRARARLLFERQNLVERGRKRWEGRRILFVMPVMAAGGGANVVITEARAMLAMGVDVRILNLKRIRIPFEESYPELEIPVVYAASEDEFVSIARNYDAVVATANHTVRWLAPLATLPDGPVIGYYVQDFEPYFYAEESLEYRIALDSYALIPQMRCLTKTAWNRDEVQKLTGVNCVLVGASYDTHLFMPRRRQGSVEQRNRLRVCAMVRPSSERRQPGLTMRVLRQLQRLRRDRVEIVIFGVADSDPEFARLTRDFVFLNVGLQTPEQMASLLNEMDIFADFSIYQAMGLTAMEAMSCGVAVIVPSQGGAGSFATDRQNALFVDTLAEQSCLEALLQLVDDNAMRESLQSAALHSVVRYAPEKAGLAILDALFVPQGT